MALLVGLTGGMGSGKSTAAKMFADKGAYVLDADAICRELMEPGKTAWKEIRDWLGEDILNEDQSLNRALIASLVFQNPTEKMKLEAILHPRVFEYEKSEFHRISEIDPHALVIIDAALLIESGNFRKVDKVLVVACEEETRIGRVLAKKKFSREDIERRLKNQMPLCDKMKHADHVLQNDGSLDHLREQVDEIYKKLTLSAN